MIGHTTLIGCLTIGIIFVNMNTATKKYVLFEIEEELSLDYSKSEEDTDKVDLPNKN